MKWTKVDYKTLQPIKKNTGWHICSYISGNYIISDDCGRWILRESNELVGVFKTLKEAKARAEHREARRTE